MLDIRCGTARGSAKVLALPVLEGSPPVVLGMGLPETLSAEIAAFLADVQQPGAAGASHNLPRPGRTPNRVLLAGVGSGDEAGWRAAGAALARAAARETAVTVRLATTGSPYEVAGLAEGLWLGSYRFRLGADDPAKAVKLRRVTIGRAGVDEPGGEAASGDPTPDTDEQAMASARIRAEAAILARDLTNTPSLEKTPAWFARQIQRAAARVDGVDVSVLDEDALAEGGFGGILAVGGGSARPPRLVEISWQPHGAATHVVLIGKGITFDSGGISIKPAQSMRLMRKDMGGGAAVAAAALGAARMGLPVRITALIPLAENMISGSAARPGDVVHHYGGQTTELRNTDAEGRVVLADALAYAARRLQPDLVVDLATLTGAQNVALGKRTAALFSHHDGLADGLAQAGDQSGERMWRMPLPDDYVALLASDVADVNNSPGPGVAGAVTAALYLREFTGDLRERWAHIDMSAPAWSDSNDGDLVKGATGWGARMLLHWLGTL